MWEIVKQYPVSLFFAVLMHVFLLAFFVVKFDVFDRDLSGGARIDPIAAELILSPNSPQRVDMEKLRQQREREQKKLEEQQQKLEDEKLEQKKQKEKQQRDELADKKRKLEAEIKQKEEVVKKRKAEEEKKKLEEVKQRKIVKEQQRKEQEKKLEQEKKAKEKKRLEDEKHKKAEADKKKKVEQQRKDELKRKKEAEQARKKKEAALRTKEAKAREMKALEDALASEMAAEESQLAAKKLAGLRGQYILAIKQRVQRKWFKPDSWRPGQTCKIKVIQGPGGTILDVKVISSSSCSPDMRRSVEKAAWDADPLPSPPAKEVFERNLNFIFDPES